MAGTSVAAPVAHSRKKRWLLKTIFWLFVAAILATLGASLWFYHTAHAALAQLDGTISIPGLSRPVTVIRDIHGVPHLTAATLDDLLLPQAYVTAQDRLAQMDLTRRFAG